MKRTTILIAIALLWTTASQADPRYLPYVYLGDPDKKEEYKTPETPGDENVVKEYTFKPKTSADPGENSPGKSKSNISPKGQFPPEGAALNPQAEEFFKRLRESQAQNANQQNAQTQPPAAPSTPSPKVLGGSGPRPPRAEGPGTLTQTQGPKGLLYTMDYREADIQDVIQDIAEITSKNFILDNQVKGPITIITNTPLDANGVWEVFLSALTVRDFTTVKVGSSIKIVRLQEASSNPLKTYSSDEIPSTANFVTQLYTLENTSAGDMINSIKPLVSKRGGDIQVYKQTNTLIITDSGQNIKRIIEIIRELDKEGAKEQLEIIPLKNADPNEVAQKVLDIFQEDSSKSSARRSAGSPPGVPFTDNSSSSSDGPVRVSKVLPDLRTQSLIVVATDKAIIRVRELVTQLDKDIKDPKGNIHVYYLEHAKAEELATVLANLSSGTSGTASSRTSSSPFSTSNSFGSSSSSLSGSSRGSSGFGSTGGSPFTRSSSSSRGGSTTASVANFSDEVKITADPNTNSLVITANLADYEALKQVIAKLDIPRRQVFIEAVIMELSIDQSRNLGVTLTGGADPGGNPILAGTNFTSLNPLALNTAALAGLSGLSVAGLSKDTVSITLSDGSTTTVPAFSAVLQALETSSNVNILSTPNILTTDNEEAEIVVGQNIPFPTSSGRDSNNNPIIQVTREDVAIILRVTPHINEGNFLRLEVFQEIKEVIPNQDSSIILNQGPSTTKRSAKTTVVVKGENTVVLGGLMGDKNAYSESRVPFLGRIPLLGWLFKGQRKQTTKTNLLIFLTPYIIDSEQDFKRILTRKIEERNNFVKRNYGWVQRREIKTSLENHQKELLKVSEEVERTRRGAKNAKVPPKPATETKNDRSRVYEKNKEVLYKKDINVDDILDSY